MKSIVKYILKYLVRAAVVVFLVSVISFVLVSKSPVDPIRAFVGEIGLANMTSEKMEQLEAYFGMDTPPLIRYMNWFKGFVKGNMGDSLIYRRPVLSVIRVKFMNTLILMLIAWVMSGIIGITLGIVSGVYKDSLVDKAIKGYSYILASIPTFWLALVLLLIFSVWMKVLPIGLSVPIGKNADEVTILDSIRHIILPALTLSVVGVANITLQTREKMIEVMQEEYILFSKSRGEGLWKIVKKHGTRNIILPAITLQFASLSEIFGGSILVEQVFSYPGLGQTAVNAGLKGDAPLLLAIAVISAVIVFSGNLIANILYGVIDPRIRRNGL